MPWITQPMLQVFHSIYKHALAIGMPTECNLHMRLLLVCLVTQAYSHCSAACLYSLSCTASQCNCRVECLTLVSHIMASCCQHQSQELPAFELVCQATLQVQQTVL